MHSRRIIPAFCLAASLCGQQPVSLRDPATGNTAAVSGASAVKVDGSAVIQPVNVAQKGGTAVVADPCDANAKSFAPFSITTGTQVIAGVSAKKVYVCAINLVAGAATNVALVEGAGSVCASGTTGMAGGATAGTGWNFAANGGLSQGNGGASIMATAVNADNVCLLVSAANQVSGVIAYVIQ